MRTLAALALAILALSYPITAADAASYSCTTVDKSAKAFVSSSSSVTITEKDRNCEISVNGVTSKETRSVLWVDAINTVLSLARSQTEISLTGELIFGLFQAPSVGDDVNAASSLASRLSSDDIELLTSCLNGFVAEVRERPSDDFRSQGMFKPIDQQQSSNISCGTVDAGSATAISDRVVSEGPTSLAAVLRDDGGTSMFVLPATLVQEAIRSGFTFTP